VYSPTSGEEHAPLGEVEQHLVQGLEGDVRELVDGGDGVNLRARREKGRGGRRERSGGRGRGQREKKKRERGVIGCIVALHADVCQVVCGGGAHAHSWQKVDFFGVFFLPPLFRFLGGNFLSWDGRTQEPGAREAIQSRTRARIAGLRGAAPPARAPAWLASPPSDPHANGCVPRLSRPSSRCCCCSVYRYKLNLKANFEARRSHSRFKG
jgi:hypothetical protein